MKTSSAFAASPIMSGQSAALITVCVASESADQMTRAMEHMSWAVGHEALERYANRDSRGHWSVQTKHASAYIAVVDLDQDTAAALETVEFLRHTLPGNLSIIGLSCDSNPAMILQAMRAGCTEYLQKPLDMAQFSDALARIERRATTTTTQAEPAGKVLSFFGAKGGVGATTLAVYLAVSLARRHHKKTLLIDNHPELGHVCLYLGLEGKHYSFPELLRNVNRLDADLLKGFVVSHASGVDVLSSPDSHGGNVRHADPEAMRHAIEFLREEYDFVLIDCSGSLDEGNMAVVDRSDHVYLVATAEMAAIRDLSRHLDGLSYYDQPSEKLRVVINRSTAKGAMTTVQIEKAVRLPIFANIPNSYGDLAKAIDFGVPISHEEKGEFSSQMREWSRGIAGAGTETAPPAKKRLAFWK